MRPFDLQINRTVIAVRTFSPKDAKEYRVKQYMMTEIYIGTVSDNLEKVLGKWSSVYNELNNL